MPTEIEAKYRVVTPMFCAGSCLKHAELRVPSFKGVLRFWWRALGWSRLNKDLQDIPKLQAIRKQEDNLFGSAGGGRSRVSVHLSHLSRDSESLQVKTGKVLEDVQEGARYLGYGAMEARNTQGTRAGELTRACLRAPFDFTVRMYARCLTDGELQSLQDALIAFGLLGGMGAKSRKGYGSVSMRSLCVAGAERWRVPRSLDELLARIGALTCEKLPADLPCFTALSRNTRHVLVTSDAEKPLQLLDLIGREIKEAIRAVPRKERAVFGLPRKPDIERRASPLFIHIDECARKPVAVLSFLPARFLPSDKSGISGGGSRARQDRDLYRPVHGFLDRLLDQKEPLQAKEVEP